MIRFDPTDKNVMTSRDEGNYVLFAEAERAVAEAVAEERKRCARKICGEALKYGADSYSRRLLLDVAVMVEQLADEVERNHG